MLVSVVIPVYNAEKYLKAAVESALSQRETGEVILVEDNSPDASLQICRELEATFDRVRVVRHPGGQNLGAGASRNLGLRSAHCDFVAFLDADDFYLENRFSEAHRIFQEQEDADGVYEAVGVWFEDSRAKERWLSWAHEDLITMRESVSSEELFSALVENSRGWLHLDGLVLRKRIFHQCGYFFENLKLHQDSAFFLQLAAMCRLRPGRLNHPVAMRRVHDHNRITAANADSRELYFGSLIHWANEKKLENRKIEILFQKYLYFNFISLRNNKQYVSKIKKLFMDFLNYPSIFIMASCKYIFARIKRA